MSAHDYYTLIVGEIGVNPDTFYKLSWWEVCSIIRGYNRRHRQLWSVGRWHAYNIMSAMPYADLQKAGINRPTDLIQFPWEQEITPITDEEAAELQAEMAALNALNQKQQAND